jgi:16S rRNA processing protein RimM
MSELICVGSIAGAFGVRGELRVKSFCANPSDLAEYTPLLTEDGEQSYELSLIGEIKNGFSARIVGIDTKEAADTLRGISLFARREDLPELPVDEYYYSDLIGFEVADTGDLLERSKLW